MATTERLTIELPSHLVKGLRESVKSGAYSSESEAIEMLLQSWYSSEGVEEPDLKTLRALVAEGIADVDAGPRI
jgi:Arc/MetJ-type ribon-helix-helix transcriptional regulator